MRSTFTAPDVCRDRGDFRTLRLSPAQKKAMWNLRLGLPVDRGIHGRSEYGGLTRTITSLYRRGLLEGDCQLSEAGRKWLMFHPAAESSPCPKGGTHAGRTDGMHSNYFCGKCFATLDDRGGN